MVEVDRARGSLEDRAVSTDSALVRAVDEQQDSLLEIVRDRPLELAEVEEPILARERRLAGEEHHAVLAERDERAV